MRSAHNECFSFLINSSLSDIDKKVSFKPNYSNILKTITSTSASYTATQDCWVVGYVRAEGSGAGSDVKIDGLTCASAIFIGSGISMSGCGVTAFAPKGSTITTGLYGTYYLNVVGVM